MGRVRKKHSREFKLEAVRALRSGQRNASELARRLGVTESHLRDWEKEYEKYKEEAFPGQGRRNGQGILGAGPYLRTLSTHLTARKSGQARAAIF